VLAAALSGGNLFVGGEFSSIGGKPRSHIGALDPVTGAAVPWDPGTNGAVRVLTVSGNTVYVGGDFTSLGREPQPHLAAVTGSAVIGLGGGRQPPRAFAQILPNPARSRIQVRFSLPSEAPVTWPSTTSRAAGSLRSTTMCVAPRVASASTCG